MTDAVTTACLESLECPVCMNIYNDPKQLSCGHTLCAGCVTQLVGASQTRSVGLGGDAAAAQHVILCPECRNPTSVPSGGLKTNYRLLDLASKMSGVDLNELHKCSTCEKRWAADELFICKTCEDSFQAQVWICGTCALKHHKNHKVVEMNLATKEERDAVVATIKEFATQGKEAARKLAGRFEHSGMCDAILEHVDAAFKKYCAKKSINKDELNAVLKKVETLRERYAKATEAAKKASDDADKALDSCLAVVVEWDFDAMENRPPCETSIFSGTMTPSWIRDAAPRKQPELPTSYCLAGRGGRGGRGAGMQVSFATRETAQGRNAAWSEHSDRRQPINGRGGGFRSSTGEHGVRSTNRGSRGGGGRGGGFQQGPSRFGSSETELSLARFTYDFNQPPHDAPVASASTDAWDELLDW
ncbi:CBN-TAM-1 protein [Aphelenchoides avenae]|nr:CBN-TAM-1 protein [Aphelenchus avenae]